MIVHGRVTLFGEYLMHNHAEGYVMMTRRYLASAEEAGLPQHPEYDTRRDSTAVRLHSMGLPTAAPVRGNLPLGHGFASSTALTLIHLRGRQRRLRAVVEIIDWQIHGFEPSGMDFESVIRQRCGLYGRRKWTPAPAVPVSCAAVIPGDRARSQLSYPEVAAAVIGRADGFAKLSGHLARRISGLATIDYDALWQYCHELRAARVYDPLRAELVEYALSAGVAAKGTGGLANKAVLLVWPDQWTTDRRATFLNEIRRGSFGAVIDEL